MKYDDILFRRKTLFLIVLTNLLGTLFGFYYYSDQLLTTDPLLWIFVPASPIATLLFAASIYLNVKDRGLPLLDSLAFISNFKYGLWTVFCLSYYSEIFFTGNSVGLYSFMLVSHFAMAIQAFLLFKWENIGWRVLFVAFLWYLFNDFIDYTFGTHTELYTEYTLPAELAAYSLTFSGLFLGLLLIQKDEILNKFHEI
ncbi:hypothetical protein HRED_05583 [Candidatus Haloredivivus sp. G17]|jgi:uncharacterized membrane protein YpjA|nr:hypothetical protein HRED_05583 [Candidatus Haloredivivus sp. G17]